MGPLNHILYIIYIFDYLIKYMRINILLNCRYDMPEEQVRAAVASALDVVNMSPYMYRATHTLSGGQRQRVAIAGLLLDR